MNTISVSGGAGDHAAVLQDLHTTVKKMVTLIPPDFLGKEEITKSFEKNLCAMEFLYPSALLFGWQDFAPIFRKLPNPANTPWVKEILLIHFNQGLCLRPLEVR